MMRRLSQVHPHVPVRRLEPVRLRPELSGEVVARIATAADRPVLERLAALDSAAAPQGTVLLGELAGQAVAAVALETGHAIADPFIASAPIVDLLKLRARQLGAPVPPLAA